MTRSTIASSRRCARTGRASYAELARLVGMSPPSVQDRIRRLEDAA
jgi:DNA-binding Lrp family transcriptional regulator